MQLEDKYKKAINVIQKMRLGVRILSACREEGISRAQLIDLANKDEQIKMALENAREECDDMLAESLVDVNEYAAYGAQDPKMAATWSKNAQWFLSKKNPIKYGEKITIEQKTTIDHVITQRMETAKNRLLEQKVIDAEFLSLSPVDDSSTLPPQNT